MSAYGSATGPEYLDEMPAQRETHPVMCICDACLDWDAARNVEEWIEEEAW